MTWMAQEKDTSRVCPWGMIQNPHEEIENLRQQYGAQKGRVFHIWADRVRSVNLSNDSWIVRFDKWERSGQFLFRRRFHLRV